MSRPKKLVHRSFEFDRTKRKDNHLERIFAKSWEVENDPRKRSFVNSGMGILQDLMVDCGASMIDRKINHFITQDEASVVATVIQWLGTNCGFSWLRETLKKGGIEIRHVDRLL